jgi:hypothetical protein
MLAATAVLLSSVCHPAVVSKFGTPSATAGVFVSCSNPERIVLVHRAAERTLVRQVGPRGTNWQRELPTMEYENEHYLAALDGSGVVVVTSDREGEAYLVGDSGLVRLDMGHIAYADFAAGRVLVVGNRFAPDGSQAASLIEVYGIQSGQLVARHDVADHIEQTVDRDFLARLSSDGKHLFYVLAEQPGLPARVVIREVASGLPVGQRSPLNAHGEILDLSMRNGSDGYLVTTRGLFVVKGGTASRISAPVEAGDPWRVIDLGAQQLHALVGKQGWAVRHWPSGRWVGSGEGVGVTVAPANDGWVVIDRSVDSSGIVHYRYGSGRAGVARRVPAASVPRDYDEFVCANAYGVMRYSDGRFDWIPGTPVD